MGRVSDRPLVLELDPVPDVETALRAVVDLPGVLLLESCLDRADVSRYSFLAADPFEVVERQRVATGDDPLGTLRERLNRWRVPRIDDLPPFQGGAAGLLGYELANAWEAVPTAGIDEFALPVLAVGLYDRVLAWDHLAGRAWLISHGFPESDPASRRQRAAARRDELLERLHSASLTGTAPPAAQKPRIDMRTSQWPLDGFDHVTTNFSRENYLAAVERVIEYIHDGDIFQANLSQRLLTPARDAACELYSRLRRCNPAPFAAYLAHDDWAVVSASPERFVRLVDGHVETRPIKGTRRRRPASEAGLFTRGELRESEKDRAENVMIVDLLRNDLSRVCRPGTVHVSQLCEVETYETVLHLVSVVHGRLEPRCDAWDLLAAVFPGGSITGAPKIRAMEIIAELEPTARGPYCGSLFYVGFDGTLDSSILIRTFTVRQGFIQCQVGGGIVAQSEPAAEFEETLDKAAGMLRAL